MRGRSGERGKSQKTASSSHDGSCEPIGMRSPLQTVLNINTTVNRGSCTPPPPLPLCLVCLRSVHLISATPPPPPRASTLLKRVAITPAIKLVFIFIGVAPRRRRDTQCDAAPNHKQRLSVM